MFIFMLVHWHKAWIRLCVRHHPDLSGACVARLCMRSDFSPVGSNTTDTLLMNFFSFYLIQIFTFFAKFLSCKSFHNFLCCRCSSLLCVWGWAILVDQDFLQLWHLQKSLTLLAPPSGCGVMWIYCAYCGDQNHQTFGDRAVLWRACCLTMAKISSC